VHRTCHYLHVINDSLASVINLLTYSDTERTLLGNRQRLGVSGLGFMGFSDEDQILKENLCVFKGYGAKKLVKKFMNNGWRL